MFELADRTVTDAAWKVRNLEDYDRRLERAARRVDELAQAHETAALVIYEAVLMKSNRSAEEVRETVRRFGETWQDEEEPLTIPRVSGIMNVESDDWFFGDQTLRVMTGQLLGQFQHRVAQYNYIDEREVLKRWANGYDTRLFIRRRIYETEPIAGVVPGVDLRLIQYLRVAAGGDTVVPGEELSRALAALGILDEGVDDYAVLAAAENLALRLELPAPIVGEILHVLGIEDRFNFPKPPPEPADEEIKAVAEAEEVTEAGGEYGTGGTDRESARPSADERAKRRAAQEEPDRGEEPTRTQDPQAKDAPGVREEEGGERPAPAAPQTGPQDAPSARDEGS